MGTFPQLISYGCLQCAAEGELTVLSCRKEMLLIISLLSQMCLFFFFKYSYEYNVTCDPTWNQQDSAPTVYLWASIQKKGSGRLSQVGVIFTHKMWCRLSLLPFSYWTWHSLLQQAKVPLTLISLKMIKRVSSTVFCQEQKGYLSHSQTVVYLKCRVWVTQKICWCWFRSISVLFPATWLFWLISC